MRLNLFGPTKDQQRTIRRAQREQEDADLAAKEADKVKAFERTLTLTRFSRLQNRYTIPPENLFNSYERAAIEEAEKILMSQSSTLMARCPS